MSAKDVKLGASWGKYPKPTTMRDKVYELEIPCILEDDELLVRLSMKAVEVPTRKATLAKKESTRK